MSSTLLTVLMPVYNAEAHVFEAVKSVLEQTYSDFKLLVVNDGCTDGSIRIIESLKDPRIEIIHLPKNAGLINALNVGLDHIETPYVARTDADDICLPARLERQLAFMQNNPEVGALGTGFDSLQPDGSITIGSRFSADHDIIRFKHLYQIHIIHGTAMLRTSVLNEHHLRFDADFPHAEDYDFFDRLGNVSRISNLPESLYLIRQHESRVSSKFSEVQWNNSSIVKLRILERIGVSACEEDLMRLLWMMYQNYAWYSMESAAQLVQLVRNTLEANQNSKYFEPEFLRVRMVQQFLHLANHLAASGHNAIPLLRQLGVAKFSDNPKLTLAIHLRSILALIKN